MDNPMIVGVCPTVVPMAGAEIERTAKIQLVLSPESLQFKQVMDFFWSTEYLQELFNQDCMYSLEHEAPPVYAIFFLNLLTASDTLMTTNIDRHRAGGQSISNPTFLRYMPLKIIMK